MPKILLSSLLGLLVFTSLELSASTRIEVTLKRNRPLYCELTSGLLRKVKILSVGSTVSILKGSLPVLMDFEAGGRDTSGFYANVLTRGSAVPASCKSARGFYISALTPIYDSHQDIEALPLKASSNATYQAVYTEAGQVKTSDSTIAWGIGRNKKRFKAIWNKTYASGELSLEKRERGEAVLRELTEFADRANPTPSNLVYLEVGEGESSEALARSLSLQTMNDYGFSPAYGAWDVAIYGTATRLGFAHAPCAEFVSEAVRQAYARAGYSHADDFKEGIREQLIFTPWQNNIFGPQSVRGLADRLVLAGWIPWDPSVYRPPVGAVAMALDAWTPGHTYLIARDGGQFIVDNGNPRGLDLRGVPLALRKYRDMYGIGVFFLPPGITPSRW